MHSPQARNNWRFSNFSGLLKFKPELYFEPAGLDELKAIVFVARQNKKKVRVVGCSHSAADLCLTADYVVSLKKLNRVLSVDNQSNIVHVQPGIWLRDLCGQLESKGLMLSVLPTIGEVTLGGALITATHGTGKDYGILSYYLREVELLTASGDIVRASAFENIDIFRAAQVSLGALGILVSIKLQCEPAYRLCRRMYPAQLADILETLPVHMTASDHFSFMWFPPNDNVSVLHISRTTEPSSKAKGLLSSIWEWLVSYLAFESLCLIGSLGAPIFLKMANRLRFRYLDGRETMAVGNSSDISFATYRSRFVAKEWCFPVEQTTSILLTMREWIERTQFPVHYVEVRFVRRDNIPLSPCYEQDSVFINTNFHLPFGMYTDYGAKWDREFERIALLYNGRPHWAKCHPLTHVELQSLYPEWSLFTRVLAQLDPTGLFSNTATIRLLGH